jgi:hypothetical protein
MDNLEQLLRANALRDPASRLVSEDAIRHRAYEIYVRRGMKDGRAEEDWLEAETELCHEAQGQDLTVPRIVTEASWG